MFNSADMTTPDVEPDSKDDQLVFSQMSEFVRNVGTEETRLDLGRKPKTEVSNDPSVKDESMESRVFLRPCAFCLTFLDG